MLNRPKIDNRKEILLTRISLWASIALFLAIFVSIFDKGHSAFQAGHTKLLIEVIVFGTSIFFMAYGNVLYQICLIGYYKRKQQHVPETREVLNAMYLRKAPSLTVLIPSYKEEHSVVWQTLISAALAEYPQKNVVLLIDDPYRSKSLEDMTKLEETRLIPVALQKQFDSECARYRHELDAFHARKNKGHIYSAVELNRISMLYDDVSEWLRNLYREFARGRDFNSLNYAEQFFTREIILAPASAHRAFAQELRRMVTGAIYADDAFIEQHYARLASLFNVSFSSFERKKYNNLSHEANKAMNLNSYITLVGKSWKEVELLGSGYELREVSADEADFTIPYADYIDTLDADTVMLHDYALRVIHLMEQPGNEKIAVVQSPCSTLPNCSNPIERVAGACIDVQFQTHQGYTDWEATSWVGANAMLRYCALEEIKEIRDEDGKKVAIYIQDRTVIEDTESTIDLVEKGWKLSNYPERMTFSPTPPDFGSLLIQRRRWSNGGMLILPKLFSYVMKSKGTLALLKEMFMRFHYLSSTTTVCISATILFLYPFGDVASPLLLPLATLPCLLIFARDLKNAGYKYSDVLRIWALTLMLFPIMIGGVLKQFQQMVTGRKIPFGRTPKVPGRTAAPALYCLVELALLGYCTDMSVHAILLHHWAQAVFVSMNAAMMMYALFVFMGVKATIQDTVADLSACGQAIARRLEVVPSYVRSLGYLLPDAREQA